MRQGDNRVILFIQKIAQLTNLSINSNQALTSSGLLMVLITSVVSIIFVFYSVRIVVIFPAIALELHDVRIKDVLQKTQKNFWSLLFAPAFCSLPTIPFAIFYWHFIKELCENNIAGSLLNTVYILLGMIITTPFYLSFLSLTYKYFFEKDES